ncbi:MAG: hypothetical protein J6X78_06780 [Treponema sp.]|nr:hypothetical protein [Treponema sp.]
MGTSVKIVFLTVISKIMFSCITNILKGLQGEKKSEEKKVVLDPNTDMTTNGV